MYANNLIIGLLKGFQQGYERVIYRLSTYTDGFFFVMRKDNKN